MREWDTEGEGERAVLSLLHFKHNKSTRATWHYTPSGLFFLFSFFLFAASGLISSWKNGPFPDLHVCQRILERLFPLSLFLSLSFSLPHSFFRSHVCLSLSPFAHYFSLSRCLFSSTSRMLRLFPDSEKWWILTCYFLFIQLAHFLFLFSLTFSSPTKLNWRRNGLFKMLPFFWVFLHCLLPKEAGWVEPGPPIHVCVCVRACMWAQLVLLTKGGLVFPCQNSHAALERL